jgi:hypothetical protein
MPIRKELKKDIYRFFRLYEVTPRFLAGSMPFLKITGWASFWCRQLYKISQIEDFRLKR